MIPAAFNSVPATARNATAIEACAVPKLIHSPVLAKTSRLTRGCEHRVVPVGPAA